MARPSDVDYRDLEKTTKDPETGEVLSLRERRAKSEEHTSELQSH